MLLICISKHFALFLYSESKFTIQKYSETLIETCEEKIICILLKKKIDIISNSLKFMLLPFENIVSFLDTYTR